MIVKNNSKIPSSKRFTICNAHWASKGVTVKEIEEWLTSCEESYYGTFCIFPEGYIIPDSNYEHVYSGCTIIDKNVNKHSENNDHRFDVLTTNGDLIDGTLNSTATFIFNILNN